MKIKRKRKKKKEEEEKKKKRIKKCLFLSIQYQIRGATIILNIICQLLMPVLNLFCILNLA